MKSDNELIAEFMGGDISSGWVTFQIPPSSLFHNYNWDVEDLAYSRSWDWLMPVVEKISKNYDVSIRYYSGDCTCYINKQTLEGSEICSFGNFEPVIKNVYKAVVEFIKWYNENKKS